MYIVVTSEITIFPFSGLIERDKTSTSSFPTVIDWILLKAEL